MSPVNDGRPQKDYWRSLDELADTPDFRRFVENEFPAYADRMLEPASRRGFLKIMGASIALAGVTACHPAGGTVAASDDVLDATYKRILAGPDGVLQSASVLASTSVDDGVADQADGGGGGEGRADAQDCADGLQGVFRLGNDLSPACPIRLAGC